MEGLIYFLQDNITGIVNAILLILIATGIFTKGEKYIAVAILGFDLISYSLQSIQDDKKLDKEELAEIQAKWKALKLKLKQ